MVTLSTLRLALLYQIAVAGVATLLSVVFWSIGTSGLFLGGLVMALNFWALNFLAARVFQNGQTKGAYVIALAFKMVLAMAVIAGILHFFHPYPVAFALGLGSLFLGIGLALLHQIGVR